MSATVLFVVVALVGLASLLCNSSCWLWISAKWFRIPNVSYLRALGAMSVIAVVNMAFEAARFAWNMGSASKIGTVVFYVVAGIVVPTLCVKLLLRATPARALAATLITVLISGIVAVPVVIAGKAFVMESFVVPTGSMAPAVIGRHFDVTCDHCRFPFMVSAVQQYEAQLRMDNRQSPNGFAPGRRTQLCICPNCRTERALPSASAIADGDKILVDKLGKARRWDVVAFWMPQQISTVYLQRLVGLPGETVEIIDGDIFINGRRESKPYDVARELWVLVNDTRFQPDPLGADDPQWRSKGKATHWQRGGEAWTFNGVDVEPENLEFVGLGTDESTYADRFTDEPFIGFGDPPNPVQDVRVQCTIARFSGAGFLGFQWVGRGFEVVARAAADGSVELRCGDRSRRSTLPGALASTKQITFAVRDGVAIVAVDEREAVGLEIGLPDEDGSRENGDDAATPARISLTAGHCQLELARIVIERDVYYRSEDAWIGCTGSRITLGRGEHYVLGDHSARANDSRLWQTVDQSLRGRYQLGTVPQELMIGVARCIYWPPERWREFK